jgi:hypothetical protein
MNKRQRRRRRYVIAKRRRRWRVRCFDVRDAVLTINGVRVNGWVGEIEVDV